MKTLIVVLSLLCGVVVQVYATRVQFVNCIADPAYPVVDVWMIQNTTYTKVADDLAFTKCTKFFEVPSGVTTYFCVAPPNSTSIADTIASFSVDKKFMIISTDIVMPLIGVLSKGMAPNPYPVSNRFSTTLIVDQKQTVKDTVNCYITAVHSITDAHILTLKSKLHISSTIGYGMYDRGSFDGFQFKAGVPDTLQLSFEDRCQSFRNFAINTTGYAGRTGVLVVTGYIDSTKNNNGSGVLAFLAWSDGSTTPLQQVALNKQRAIVKFMNACADPDVKSVDVYVDGIKIEDNLPFRSSSKIDTLYVNTEGSEFVITKAESQNVNDEVISKQTMQINHCVNNAIVIHGVAGSGFKGYSKRDINVKCSQYEMYRGSTNAINSQYVHAVTDAPMYKLNVSDARKFFTFDSTDYRMSRFPDANFLFTAVRVSFTPVVADIQDSLVYTFTISQFKGKTGIFILSGFLTSGENKNGEKVGLHLAQFNKVGLWEDVNGISAVDDFIVSDSKLLLYPNPSNNNIGVHFSTMSSNAVTIEVNDIVGNVISITNVGLLEPGEHNYSVNTTAFPVGVYTCVVKKDNQTVTSRFMVVR